MKDNKDKNPTPVKRKRGRPKKSDLSIVGIVANESRIENEATRKGKRVEVDYEKLESALYEAQDYFGRATIAFILTGRTLNSMIKGAISGWNIEFSVTRKSLSKFGKHTLKVLIPDIRIGRKMIAFTLQEVPFQVRIIDDTDKYYQFFRNPGLINYMYTSFHVPNPLDDYLEENK